jgi:hypothetical protein
MSRRVVGPISRLSVDQPAGAVDHRTDHESATPRSTSLKAGVGRRPAKTPGHRIRLQRNTHTYLDLDAGEDFDRQIIVKINTGDILARELHRPSWSHEPVELSTNTDPYQRAEGRYRLMPGVIAAMTGSGTPFSIFTKGTTARRDLPLLTVASNAVPVSMGVSIALIDESIHAALDPATPTPRARLDLVEPSCRQVCPARCWWRRSSR